jgi:flagellar protein FlbT
MYISRDPAAQHSVYFALMRDTVQAAPSAWKYIANINNQILTGDLYKALKHARKLIEYEQELFKNATGDQGLRSGSATDRQSA